MSDACEAEGRGWGGQLVGGDDGGSGAWSAAPASNMY